MLGWELEIYHLGLHRFKITPDDQQPAFSLATQGYCISQYLHTGSPLQMTVHFSHTALLSTENIFSAFGIFLDVFIATFGVERPLSPTLPQKLQQLVLT